MLEELSMLEAFSAEVLCNLMCVSKKVRAACQTVLNRRKTSWTVQQASAAVFACVSNRHSIRDSIQDSSLLLHASAFHLIDLSNWKAVLGFYPSPFMVSYKLLSFVLQMFPESANGMHGEKPFLYVAVERTFDINIASKLAHCPGIHINALNGFGVSALGLAAGYGLLDIVNLLLERGADPSLCGSGSMSPLQIAAQSEVSTSPNYFDVIGRLISAGADTKYRGIDLEPSDTDDD